MDALEGGKYGDELAFCEPAWYKGYASPHYRASHVQLRNNLRGFVDKVDDDELLEKGAFPKHFHKELYALGVNGLIFPKELGGTPPADYDAFHEMIMWDELGRETVGAFGQMSINAMACPPIVKYGSEQQQDMVVRPVVKGEKNCCLAISEPTAGSDVGGLKTTAVRDGDHYVVNGEKKWITGGMVGDYLLTAVRTGDNGMMGLSLLIIPRDTPGITFRQMPAQFDSVHHIAFITFNNARVPVANLVGEENQGFMYLMTNFNHERWIIAIGACRSSRTAYSLSLHYALKRKTFGKFLIEHQAIRLKLAECARLFEALHTMNEHVAFQYKSGVQDTQLGGYCSLLKVNASRCFEVCAREAMQIFGGASLIKEGQGRVIERLYRAVRLSAIPGGSEEILLDFAIRQGVSKALRKAKEGSAKL